MCRVVVVSKIDVHRGWRDVLTSNRDRLVARASRHARCPAARPHLSWASFTWTTCRRHSETARRSGWSRMLRARGNPA